MGFLQSAGQIVGGAIGFMMGGPWGAAIGAGLGGGAGAKAEGASTSQALQAGGQAAVTSGVSAGAAGALGGGAAQVAQAGGATGAAVQGGILEAAKGGAGAGAAQVAGHSARPAAALAPSAMAGNVPGSGGAATAAAAKGAIDPASGGAAGAAMDAKRFASGAPPLEMPGSATATGISSPIGSSSETEMLEAIPPAPAFPGNTVPPTSQQAQPLDTWVKPVQKETPTKADSFMDRVTEAGIKAGADIAGTMVGHGIGRGITQATGSREIGSAVGGAFADPVSDVLYASMPNPSAGEGAAVSMARKRPPSMRSGPSQAFSRSLAYGGPATQTDRRSEAGKRLQTAAALQPQGYISDQYIRMAAAAEAKRLQEKMLKAAKRGR